jgi:hypothetical protein
VHSSIGAPNSSHSSSHHGVNGLGTLGTDSATAGSDRQEFDFDVAADLSAGRLFHRDWAIVRSDSSTVGTLTVDPMDASTAITAYRDWSRWCADPTRGAEFDGTGRLDTDSLTSFTVATCDNGAAGSGADFFQMDVPSENYSHGRFLSSGDVVKSGTATLTFEDGFEEANALDNWREVDSIIRPIGPNSRYQRTTTVAKSGTHSLQAFYDTVDHGAFGGIARGIQGQEEVFIRFYVMFEEGFKNLRVPDSGGMHFFTLAGDTHDGSNTFQAGVKPDCTVDTRCYFYAGIDPEHDPDRMDNYIDSTLYQLQFYTYWPDMGECPPDYDPVTRRNCFGRNSPQTPPKIPFDVDGVWQEVVFHLKMNTGLDSNGSQTLWINGVKKIDIQGMRWRADGNAAANLKINAVRFDNFMDRAPKPEYVWVDDITVWRP